MTTTTSRIIEELADREAIRECQYRLARGIDRLDAAMLHTAYWPDAHIDYGGMDFTGSPRDYIGWAFPKIGSMNQIQHFLSNMLMTIRGNTADAEVYYYIIQNVNLADGKRDVIGAGRYLDRLEKRGEEWRIVERLVVTDSFREFPDSADWSNGMMGFQVEPGRRFPDDQSYTRIRIE
jgi:hypothetical protein